MCWKGTEGGEGRKEGGRNDGAENELREATEGGRDGRRAELVFGEGGGTRHLYSYTDTEIDRYTHAPILSRFDFVYLCLFYLLFSFLFPRLLIHILRCIYSKGKK